MVLDRFLGSSVPQFPDLLSEGNHSSYVIEFLEVFFFFLEIECMCEWRWERQRERQRIRKKTSC